MFTSPIPDTSSGISQQPSPRWRYSAGTIAFVPMPKMAPSSQRISPGQSSETAIEVGW